MGDYLNVTWVTEAPVAAGMSWSNVCFLASGNRPNGCSNPQLVSSSDYATLIDDSTRYERKALASYYKNFTGSPTNSTYVYWMGAGDEITGIAYGSDLQYQIDFGPYVSIDTVSVDPTGGSNWQEMDPFVLATAPSGYIAMTGAYGKYDGRIWFSGVMDGEVDDGGPYFTSGSGDPVFSGTLAREIMAVSGGRILVQATRNGFGVASQEIIPKDIQFICAPYDVCNSLGSGIMGDSGAIDDLRNMLGMCAGNRMMTVWAMPKASAPNTDYIDESFECQNIRDSIGQDKNAVIIYADVATGTDGSGVDDPAAALLGKICDSHPHTTLTLASLNIGLASRTQQNEKSAWDAGQVCSIFRKADLGFSTDQLSYGFTLAGTSPSNRLNNVRCKYLVEYNVLSDLWGLLSSRTVKISKSGLTKIIETINGTLNRLQSQGIIDSGDRIVSIPLMNGTTAEWTNARLTRKIPAIIVRWSWNTSPEQLNITQFGEIL